MNRRTSLVLGAMLTMLAMPLAAWALSAASAALSQGTDVLPGQRQFEVTVRNGHRLSGAAPIDYVAITLPHTRGISNDPDRSIVAPSGWTVEATSKRNLQQLVFRGGSIAAGKQTKFAFPATVAAPTAADQVADFRVVASDNSGKTREELFGALTTTIRVLEIVPGSVRPTAPAGVTDRSGTAGQAGISYGSAVRNHALQALTVATALGSDGGDVFSTAPAQSIAPGATATFARQVALGQNPEGADRVATFTASATATGATAVSVTDDFTVQTAPVLELSPTSFTPAEVRRDADRPRTFMIDVTKSGSPALHLNAGRLSFAATEGDLRHPAFLADATTASLAFGPAAVQGADGSWAAEFVLSGVDGNDHPFATSVTLPDLVRIDTVAPFVTLSAVQLPVDGDGDRKTAVGRSGDAIRVCGSLDEPGTIRLLVHPDAGADVPMAVTYSGTAFCGEATPTFHPSAGSFVITAVATDPAENTRTSDHPGARIDQTAPVLASASVRSASVVEVRFTDDDVVLGGCNHLAWQLVRPNGVASRPVEVRTLDPADPSGTTGLPCAPHGSASGPHDARLLILSDPLSDGELPAVTYTRNPAPNMGAAKDGAGNPAATATLNAIDAQPPPVPSIAEVWRNTSGPRPDWEPVTLDTGAYWTRFGANDLLLVLGRPTGATSVEVLDGGDTVLRTVTVPADGPVEVSVPISGVDGAHPRGVRFRNAAGVAGPRAAFTVQVDTVAPRVKTAVFDGFGRVDMTFNEATADGTDTAADWFVVTASDPGHTGVDHTRVSATERLDAMTLRVTLAISDPFSYLRMRYLFDPGSPNARRYVDRAGNHMADE